MAREIRTTRSLMYMTAVIVATGAYLVLIGDFTPSSIEWFQSEEKQQQNAVNFTSGSGFIVSSALNEINQSEIYHGGESVEDSQKEAKQSSTDQPPTNVSSLKSRHDGSTNLQWSFSKHVVTNASSRLLRIIPEIEYRRNFTSLSCSVSFFVYDLPYELSTGLEKIVLYGKNDTRNMGNENAETELALVRLFRTSPCRVQDPYTADFYVVPYLHAAHCQTYEGYRKGCGNVRYYKTSNLVASLKYYNESSSARHVFILGWGTFTSHELLESQPLTLSAGPKGAGHANNNTIVIPILNDHIRCQPSKLHMDFENRTKAFSFVYGGLNPRMRRKSGKRYRVYFADEVRSWNESTVAGMPYILTKLEDGSKVDSDSLLALYRQSVICPVLPGDICWQRRFFDVILSGCIPLVIEWNVKGQRTWFVPRPHHYIFGIDQAYPFYKGDFHNASFEIDYNSFVLRYHADASDETNFSSMKQFVEQALVGKKELQRKQTMLAKYAPILSYGVGSDAHKYKDAFWGVLQALKHYNDYEIGTERQ